MYTGQAVSLKSLGSDLLELVFDLQGESVNKFNALTLKELKIVMGLLKQAQNIKGLLISSAKPAFIVGADVTEFQDNFGLQADALKEWIGQTHAIFNTLEELPFPSVAMINGMAFGGGFEFALCADFRVLANDAQVGLPEVQLGICPGWGGTVRLSRLIGAENALNWMISGKPQKATAALNSGAVDSLAEAGELRESALAMLEAAAVMDVDYVFNRRRKQQPLNPTDSLNDHIAAIRETLVRKPKSDYPAAMAILDAVSTHTTLPFEDALTVETQTIVSLAKSPVAQSLIGLFLNDQLLKKKARGWCQQAGRVKKSAVLGAGIMGGGVAYQSASTGTPIVMKDIREEALTLGMQTAADLLDRKVEKGQMDGLGKSLVLDDITATLDFEAFGDVDFVVEAVVENAAIKAAVLAEVESVVPATAVLASNTSTIAIDTLAEGVARPAQFCGMHFFNPVHLMPLVEVIRGRQTSEKTIALAVAYASAMGKTAIVVNDCPGFLVNRILFPYFNAFNRLLIDGVDFQRIDRVMEQFGWPMGPAYLADVVGIDTLVHADRVMQQGYPDRMGHDAVVIAEGLLADGYLGQKNAQGFYTYGVDAEGRRFKEPSARARELITKHRQQALEISDQEIIDRMMIPMCLEAVRCLEDGIVETAAEVDMGLILGLGFPRFRGGALRYIDTLGLECFAEKAEANRVNGSLYALTEGFRARIADTRTFY